MCNSTLCGTDASAAPKRALVNAGEDSSTSSDEASSAKPSSNHNAAVQPPHCKWCLYASASEVARKQRGARGRKARDRALAFATGEAGSIRKFRFVFKGALSLRMSPAMDSAGTGKFLCDGEVFDVAGVVSGEDGQSFLRLADGRGWAFALHPKNGTVVAAEELAVEVATEECLCRFHSGTSKAAQKSGVLPSYSPCFYWIAPYLSWWKAGA